MITLTSNKKSLIIQLHSPTSSLGQDSPYSAIMYLHHQVLIPLKIKWSKIQVFQRYGGIFHNSRITNKTKIERRKRSVYSRATVAFRENSLNSETCFRYQNETNSLWYEELHTWQPFDSRGEFAIFCQKSHKKGN